MARRASTSMPRSSLKGLKDKPRQIAEEDARRFLKKDAECGKVSALARIDDCSLG